LDFGQFLDSFARNIERLTADDEPVDGIKEGAF
jgi:hypothetical protein